MALVVSQMKMVVGYVQATGDLVRQAQQVRALAALGCQTVRVEGAAAPDKMLKPVLEVVGGFLAPGDELVAPDITHLGSSPRAAELFLSRMEARGVRLRLLDPGAMEGEAAISPGIGSATVEVLVALPQVGRVVDAGTVRALSDHGFGPSQIARKLGVSRMTVWRKLATAGV